MKIAVANDHRGVNAIEQVKAIVAQFGHECVDFGSHGKKPVDYPDVAYQAALAVSTGQDATKAARLQSKGSTDTTVLT